jgi:alkylation response protein AidB-like acyl-CoA dehydrogenase
MRLTEQQQTYLADVRRACADIVPDEATRLRLTNDDADLNADSAFATLAERGLLGVSLPAEDGGGGRTFTEECLLLEETARTGVPVFAYSTALTAAQSYLKWGDARQRRTVVESIVSGHVESVTFTEPSAGSDLASVTTRAVRDGDD